MVLKEREFKAHIKKGEYSRLYVITGDEKFLVSHYTGEFVKKVMGENPPDFNYHILDNNATIDEIAVAVDVMPFMSKYNMVKVKDYNINELRKDDFERLKEVFKNLPETTILLFTFPTLDLSGKNYGALMTYAKKNGVLTELKQYDKNALAKALVEGASKRGCSLSEVSAGKIVDCCGTDLNTLHNELEKLCAYADGSEITVEMINSLVHINLETKVYYMADSIIAGNLTKAYRELCILFNQKAEPISVVGAIGGAYIDLYRSRVAAENGIPLKTVAQDFGYGARSFVLSKSARNGKHLATEQIRDSIDAIITTDQKLKSTGADGRVLIEKLLARLSLIAGGINK